MINLKTFLCISEPCNLLSLWAAFIFVICIMASCKNICKIFEKQPLIYHFLLRFSHDYSEGKSEQKIKFSFAFILVFFQSFLTYFFAAIILRFNNGLSLIEHFKLGFYNTVSMLGSNSALNYVSYPVQALMKSCKILSVILVTFVVGGHHHSRIEVFCAVLITIGIFIFNLQVFFFLMRNFHHIFFDRANPKVQIYHLLI